MRALEHLAGEARVVLSMLRGMPRKGVQQDRLNRFYGDQAAAYDRFRERLLAGRRELLESLDVSAGSLVVELGAGTGDNLRWFPGATQRACNFELVDLCQPLLAQARRRCNGLANVRVIEADAATYRSSRPADLVLLSYALSMMPQWQQVLDNAQRMLRPGGRLAVVDFYVSDANPPPPKVRHTWFTRTFWPRWFAHDGVHLDPQRLSALQAMFPTHEVHELRHRLPYLPGLQVPYFRFVGVRQL
jgi:S-adenosylmethionine-diacylgycerolhomoserine-N-methlytransferase